MQRSQNSLTNDPNLDQWLSNNSIRVVDAQRRPTKYIVGYNSYNMPFDNDISSSIDFAIYTEYTVQLSQYTLTRLMHDQRMFESRDQFYRSMINEQFEIDNLCKKYPALDQAKKNFDLLLSLVRK
jgi:hypothetical protein